MSTMVPLRQIQHLLPLELQSIYNLRHRGQAPWLVRRGRLLWVQLDELTTWAKRRGWCLQLGQVHGDAA